MPRRIEDFALLGAAQTAALVSNEGSIDWLRLPRFDSPASFAALLGNKENGRWQIVLYGHVLERRTSIPPRGRSAALTSCHPVACGAAMPPVVRVDHLRSRRQPTELRLEIRVIEAPGPPCRSTTVGRCSICGPSGTSTDPSTSNHSRVPFTSMCTRLLLATEAPAFTFALETGWERLGGADRLRPSLRGRMIRGP
jgi:hypothetical protein